MTPAVSRIRVRYAETDGMGVVHHTHYLVWFEVGRTDCMREHGCPYPALEARGVFFPVVEAGVRYHRPARYDENLVVETTIGKTSAVRVRFDYVLRRGEGGELLASGFTVHAAVDGEGRPRRLPEELRKALAPRAGAAG